MLINYTKIFVHCFHLTTTSQVTLFDIVNVELLIQGLLLSGNKHYPFYPSPMVCNLPLLADQVIIPSTHTHIYYA